MNYKVNLVFYFRKNILESSGVKLSLSNEKEKPKSQLNLEC